MKPEFLIILVLLLFFLSKQNYASSLAVNSVENAFRDTLKKLRDTGIYSDDTLRSVEQIYRLETRHFDSDQFKKTLSAGMQAANDNPPFYGWSSKNFLKPNGKYVKLRDDLVEMTDSGGNKVKFLDFYTLEDAMLVLAMFLERYNRAGRWFSTDENKMSEYESKLSGIETPLFDSII